VIDVIRKYALVIFGVAVVALAAYFFIQNRRAKTETA
jgi:hypothetical protein